MTVMGAAATLQATDMISWAGKLLTFGQKGENCGVSVRQVRKIIRYGSATTVPQTPDSVKGLLNLREEIVHRFDLRRKFDLGGAGVAERKCMIVAQVTPPLGYRASKGFIADGVDSDETIAVTDTEPAPHGVTACMQGLANLENRVFMLSGIDEIAGSEAVEKLDGIVRTI